MSNSNRYRLSMELSGRKEELLVARRLFFLSVEGHQTEACYFKCLRRKLRVLPNYDADLHIIEHLNDGRTSVDAIYNLLEECKRLREGEKLLPDSVLQVLNLSEETVAASLRDKQKKKAVLHQLHLLGINLAYRRYLKEASSSEDYFVIVLDRDCGAHTEDAVGALLLKCKQEKIICCLTNPCFEFWLLLHLVDKGELLKPEELERIKENARSSQKHTYVSKKVSDLAKHAKRIPSTTFDTYYWERLPYAMEAAQAFATKNEDLIERVGTTLPDLIDKLSCLGMCSGHNTGVVVENGPNGTSCDSAAK